MKIATRFLFALLLLVAAGAAACSSGSGSPGPVTPAPSGSNSSTVYPLTMTQPDGSTAVIPKRPTRIMSVDNPRVTMDTLGALGVGPIGGMVYKPGRQPNVDSRGIPNEVAGMVKEWTAVGADPFTPDLEKVIELKPDLIIGSNGTKIGNFEQLKAIAPVLSVQPSGTPGTDINSVGWVPMLKELGRVLDRQAEAQAFLDKLEAAAAPVRKAVEGKSVDFVVLLPGGQNFNLFLADSKGIGRLFSYLGLKLRSSMPDSFSRERVDVLTADYLVLAFSPEQYDGFLANPLVAKLPAVRAGHVIKMPKGDYEFGDGSVTAGALGQLAALEGIKKAFTTTGTAP